MKYYFVIAISFIIMGCNGNSKKIDKSVEKKSQEISTSQTIPTGQKKLIIPGIRIGNIKLEENFNPVSDSLGKPYSGDAAMGKAVMNWKTQDNELSIYTSQKMGVEDFSRIKAIRSLSSDFKTEDNLGVNSTLEELKRYYRLDATGKFVYNGKHYFLYKTQKGIAFEIGMDQKCNGVLLYLKNTDPDSFYIPMYPNFKKLYAD